MNSTAINKTFDPYVLLDQGNALQHEEYAVITELKINGTGLPKGVKYKQPTDDGVSDAEAVAIIDTFNLGERSSSPLSIRFMYPAAHHTALVTTMQSFKADNQLIELKFEIHKFAGKDGTGEGQWVVYAKNEDAITTRLDSFGGKPAAEYNKDSLDAHEKFGIWTLTFLPPSLKATNPNITIDLGQGQKTARAWGIASNAA
ncbi:hypothetical protein [Cysteiniphilum litorale]|uniref:hypothetical protein n=1 Tax=Cysteiniphilum litorale TaxID=2056700 RepID=UPI003F881221